MRLTGVAEPISLISVFFGFTALAASGTTDDWAPTCYLGRIAPGPGVTSYVSTAGSDSGCVAGHTYRTLDYALSCAHSGDNISVIGTFSEAITIHNHTAFTSQVLIDGNGTAVFDGSYQTKDYDVILDISNSSNIAVQGITIQNTIGGSGPNPSLPNGGCYLGGRGIKISKSNHFKVSGNTVSQIGHEGLYADGTNTNIEVSNNLFQNLNMLNLNGSCEPNYWHFHDSGLVISQYDPKDGGTRAYSSNMQVLNNDIHGVWGECVTFGSTDTGSVTGNRVYDCVGVGLYINTSKNVQVARNFVTWTNEAYQYNDSTRHTGTGRRMAGIQIANESHSPLDGYSTQNIQIWSNIVEKSNQGIRFAKWDAGLGSPSVTDTYSGLNIAFNDVNQTNLEPVKIDQPYSGQTGTNHFRQNILRVDAGAPWNFENNSGWDGITDTNDALAPGYNTVTDINPGWYFATAQGPNKAINYQLVTSAGTVRDGANHSLEPSPFVATQDFWCRDRTANAYSSKGAKEWPSTCNTCQHGMIADTYFPLNQSILFTGTSSTTGSQGSWVQVGSAVSFTVPASGTTVANVELFAYVPAGPSNMSIDLAFNLDHGPSFTGRYSASPISFTQALSGLGPGVHTLYLQARGVLNSGPPSTVYLYGNTGGAATGCYTTGCGPKPANITVTAP